MEKLGNGNPEDHTLKQAGMIRRHPLSWTLNGAMWKDNFVFNNTT